MAPITVIAYRKLVQPLEQWGQKQLQNLLTEEHADTRAQFLDR